MDPQHFDPAQLGAMLGIFMIFGLVMFVIMIIPYWFIFKKAGFSPWLTLLMLVPLANIIILYVVAFSQWRVVPIDQVPMLAQGQPPSSFQPLR